MRAALEHLRYYTSSFACLHTSYLCLRYVLLHYPQPVAMAATMITTAAPPPSRFTPSPGCLESMFLTYAARSGAGCIPTTIHGGCPIYYLGLTDYYNPGLSTSCYPNPTEAPQGCPSGYTTACAKSTATPPVFHTDDSTLNWPVTKVDAVCCPT